MKERLKKIIDRIWCLTDDFDYSVILFREKKPFEDESLNFSDPEINTAYAIDNHKWTHQEYVKCIRKKITIEPDYCCCVTDFNKILLSSVFFINLVPSFPRYILSFFRSKKHFPSAIMFDGAAGVNYFHFFSDVINKAWLLPNIPGSKDLPLIIGEKIYNTKYFQYLLNNTELKNYNWFVQRKGEYITVDEVFLLRPFSYEKAYFDRLRSWLKIPALNVRERKVFINRSVKTGRNISNFEEIKPLLLKYGFEIINLDNVDLDFQIQLFNSTAYLISIHGAANTNILFADRTLRFLELNPADRISCQFYWLSLSLNIQYYDVVMGGKLRQVANSKELGFELSPVKLEAAIIKMLKTP